MPLVAVGIPIARASAVPTNAGDDADQDGDQHGDVLLAGCDHSAEHADHSADENRGDDAGDCHVVLQRNDLVIELYPLVADANASVNGDAGDTGASEATGDCQASSGTRRWANTSSNSPSATSVAPAARIDSALRRPRLVPVAFHWRRGC